VKEKIAGVLLAGGESRRFGFPKAFARKNGKAFYRYSLEALAPFSDTMLIVTNPNLHARFTEENLPLDIVNDAEPYQGQGPLAGIYTAMREKKADWYIMLPVDVPYIEKSVVERLLAFAFGDTEVVIPIASGRMHPLIGVYHASAGEKIAALLDGKKRSVRFLLDQCQVKYVEMREAQPFTNINHQSDYQQFIKNE